MNNGVKCQNLVMVCIRSTRRRRKDASLMQFLLATVLLIRRRLTVTKKAVGNAIVKCGIPREELFITTKVWISNSGYEKAKTSIEESLRKLKTDYIDLLLIHQPFGDYYGTYRAMEEAYKAGKVKAIGVSNFYPDRFIDIHHFAEIKPAINQVETHVFQQQKTAKEYLKKCGAQIESWGPFAEGKNDYFNNPVLKEIGAKHGKSTAQVALRFLMQSDVVVIPKSTHKERMEENFNVFDFTLTAEEMEAVKRWTVVKVFFSPTMTRKSWNGL